MHPCSQRVHPCFHSRQRCPLRRLHAHSHGYDAHHGRIPTAHSASGQRGGHDDELFMSTHGSPRILCREDACTAVLAPLRASNDRMDVKIRLAVSPDHKLEACGSCRPRLLCVRCTQTTSTRSLRALGVCAQCTSILTTVQDTARGGTNFGLRTDAANTHTGRRDARTRTRGRVGPPVTDSLGVSVDWHGRSVYLPY